MAEPLTLAIPFNRGVEYLRLAVESVCAQTSSDWRLLVVDDGARDGELAERLGAADDPRMRFVRNTENLGMVRCWNRCLALAETDLVTLLHADDLLEPGYVALMQGLAAAHTDAAAFFCEARIIDADGRAQFSLADRVKPWLRPSRDDTYVLAGEPALRALVRGNFIMCPTLCWRRSRLVDRRFLERWQQVQDLELTTRLLLEGERLVGSRAVAYAYRRHAGAATARQSDSLVRFDEELRLLGELAERAAERGWTSAERVARHRGVVRLHLMYRAGLDLLRGQFRRAARQLRLALAGASRG